MIKLQLWIIYTKNLYDYSYLLSIMNFIKNQKYNNIFYNK